MYFYRVALVGSAAPELTYHCDTVLREGAIVEVPLKQTFKTAVILGVTPPPSFSTHSIVQLNDRAYAPWQMEMARFVSTYYFSSFSEALSLFVPYNAKGFLRAVGEGSAERLASDAPNSEADSKGGSDGVRPVLTAQQQRAYEALLRRERALLFGVTGSGKTEVFISLIFHTLSEGKTAIFLMPEIALTPQMEQRLRAYFGDAVALWHSKITRKKKEQILKEIDAGTVRIVAGARSALFVPLRDLGLLVVDEEHDESYKSHTRPRYHARDLAILMGQKRRARVVLASATPSATSYYKYDIVRIERPYVVTKKRYRFVGGEGITPPIIEALERHHRAGGQALMFVPTRGNFKYLYCPNCGETHTCPYCSVGMALHRKHRYLKCHYCNHTEPIRESCIACGYAPLSSERIGTAEAIEQIREALPSLRIQQFDRDTITTPRKLKQALQRLEEHECDLLLGTQMLAKGHDYADLTLSIITGIDYVSGIADYRARERAMALLVQIAGRSGRAREAEVLIQTADPENYRPYLEAYDTFLEEELAFLEAGRYPPFAHLARILIANGRDDVAARITQETVAQLSAYDAIEIVGHGKAPIERIANRYRYTILLRAQARTPLLRALHAVNRREIEIDMDPVEFS